MILDSGIATFYHRENRAENGKKPVFDHVQYYQGYYGELAFETNPAYPTDSREEVRTDARIRVLQNRTITNEDAVLLEPVNGVETFYRVTRCYHGTDDESGELITDINLTETESWAEEVAE